MNRLIASGAVILTSITVLFIVTVTVQKVDFSGRTKHLYVTFNKINGLQKKHDVEYAGFRIGYVENITIEPDHILVDLAITEDVQINRDPVITIEEKSALGGRKVTISRNTDYPDEYVQYYSTLAGIDPVSLIDKASDAFQAVGDVGDEVRGLVKGVRDGKGTAGKFFNDETLYEDLQETMQNLKEITRKVNEGEGTIGAAINDSAMWDKGVALLEKFDRVHVRLAGRSLMQPEWESSASRIALEFETEHNKFYVIGGNLLSWTRHQTPYVTRRSQLKKEKNQFFFEALIGRRFLNDQLSISAGALESQPGGRVEFAWKGLDAFDDQHLRFILEIRGVIDTTRIDERSDPAFGRFLLATSFDVDWLPRIHLYGGVDNFFDDTIGVFGAGFDFQDDDLKILAGALSGGAG